MSNSYARGQKDTRPWGTWEVVDCGETYCVKKIVVTPGNILSLQSHDHRNEHWIIVSGEATVTLGDRVLLRRADEAVYIPAGTKHRIANDGKEDMCFIEVQTGEKLDENDIVRYEDKYGRSK